LTFAIDIEIVPRRIEHKLTIFRINK